MPQFTSRELPGHSKDGDPGKVPFLPRLRKWSWEFGEVVWLEFTRQSTRGKRVLEICGGSPSSVQLPAEPHIRVKILLEAGAGGVGNT